MTIEELLKSRRIYLQDVDYIDIQTLLDKAKNDLEIAEKILPESIPWAYTITYNAVLQASRAFIFSQGFRPASNEAHKNTFLFLQAMLEDELKTLITYFDRVRVKRHQAVYDAQSNITGTELEGLLSKARDFISIIGKRIKETHKQ